MTDSSLLDAMAEELYSTFWDFRCYFLHGGGNSIPFDFDFFRLAKKSEIVFWEKTQPEAQTLFMFKDHALNAHLVTKTVEEHAFKSLVMHFFYLRKEFMKVKRGEKEPESTSFYLDMLMMFGRCYGSIDMLEALKREVIWNQSNDRHILIKGRVFTKPLGDDLDKALKIIRNFRRVKKRGRDRFTLYLVSLFEDFYKLNGRYPRNKEVERLLANGEGNGFIHHIGEEIEWGAIGNTKLSTLQNRLVEVRKLIRKKITASGKP